MIKLFIKIKNWIWNWILGKKKAKEEEPTNTRSYRQDKDNWIHYKDRKEKVKLRSIIRDAATKIAKFNDKNYNQNRQALIDAYEIGGIDSVAKTIKEELQRIIEKKNKLDNQMLENVRKQKQQNRQSTY